MIPEIECPDCDGHGERIVNHEMIQDPLYDEAIQCEACKGEGWRPMTDEEQDAAAERQAEDAMSEPPMLLDEQHARAWAQKMELRS